MPVLIKPGAQSLVKSLRGFSHLFKVSGTQKSRQLPASLFEVNPDLNQIANHDNIDAGDNIRMQCDLDCSFTNSLERALWQTDL